MAVLLACVAPGVAQVPAPVAVHRAIGIVVDGDGNGVAEARVKLTGYAHPELPPGLAWALGPEAHLTIDGVADARGVFKVELPHAGPFALVAFAADGRRSGHCFPVMAQDFVRATLRPTVMVSGTVCLDDGTPVAGAAVAESDYSGAAESRERHGRRLWRSATTTDAQGRFRLQVTDADADCAPNALRSLCAWHQGLGSQERFYRIDVQSLDGVRLTLQGQAWSGVPLRAATGQLLAGARAFEFGDAAGSAVSGADGRFELGGGDGASVFVLARGHAVTAWPSRPGATLAQGAGATWQVMTTEGPARQHRVVLAVRIGNGVHAAWQTTTDSEGRLEVREAVPGSPLHAFVEVGGRFEALPCVVPDGTDLGTVKVGTEASITGTVLAADGMRVRGALVLLQPMMVVGDEPVGMTSLPTVLSRLTYSDRGGRFRFDVVPRRPHRLAVVADFHGVRVLELAAGATAGEVSLQGEIASGSVRFAGGSPAAGVRVQYLVMGGPAGLGMAYLHGRTDAEGRFTVQGLPPHTSFTAWGMGLDGTVASIGSNADQRRADLAIQLVLQPHPGRF